MRFVIINDCDAPCKKHIAERVKGKYYYMARAIEKYLKQFDGMTPRNPTPIEDFGFQVVVGQKEAAFVRTSDSTAKYPDGKPRRWQGESDSFVLPLVKLGRSRA